MPLSKLIGIVTPPANPLESEIGLRKKVEVSLKTALPESYIEYAKIYGSGSFSDPAHGALEIYNPLAKNYINHIKERLKWFREYRKDEGKEAFEYPVFPKQPGVLPLGADESRDLFFLVDGAPDAWAIVVQDRDDSGFRRYDLSLPDFLATLFSGQAMPPWPHGLKAEELSFVPSELTWNAPKQYRNLCQIYVDNGNKADFWASTDVMDFNGSRYYVKSIAGNSSGPLEGTHPNYASPAAIVDAYSNGEILYRDFLLEPHYVSLTAYYLAPAIEPRD